MVIIDVHYPLGFVHATPWLTHVNEGRLEWPPSPWRLLRALVSTWKTRCDDLVDGDVLPLLDALAAPPLVSLAPRGEGAIRSYLPSEASRTGCLDTDLAVDAFAAVARDGPAVSYRWDVELAPSQLQLLARLVEATPYLGRAESVCAARLRPPGGGDDGRWLAPAPDDHGTGVRTMVAARPLDVDALCVRIADMRAARRLRPPGSEWVRYPVDPPVSGAGQRHARVAPRVPVALLAITGPALVSVRDGLVVAEAVRAAAMSKFGCLHPGQPMSTALAGKDEAGSPLVGNAHAHWIPLALHNPRLVDHVAVWAPGRPGDGGWLGPHELDALAEVHRLWFHGGDRLGDARSLNVALEAVGGSELLPSWLAGPATVWESRTPYVPQRHYKARRDGPREEDRRTFLEACVRRELAARHWLPSGAGEQATIGAPEVRRTWSAFRRHRRKDRLAAAERGYGLRIEFDQAVDGPIVIGANAHFGLGIFGAVK